MLPLLMLRMLFTSNHHCSVLFSNITRKIKVNFFQIWSSTKTLKSLLNHFKTKINSATLLKYPIQVYRYPKLQFFSSYWRKWWTFRILGYRTIVQSSPSFWRGNSMRKAFHGHPYHFRFLFRLNHQWNVSVNRRSMLRDGFML